MGVIFLFYFLHIKRNKVRKERKLVPNLNNDPNVHYVKFIRGSITAWENLNLTPERIDDDTLYFIYSSAQNTREGKLYLGQKLISGVGGAGGNISIDDITDIDIDGTTLADKQILVYNETTEQWENTSLSTIIDTAVDVMQGATLLEPGEAGLVPAPAAGDHNKFLKGDGTWAPIAIPTFDSDIFAVNNNQVTLQGYGLASVGTVPLKTNNGIEWSSITGKLDRQITTLQKLEDQLAGLDPDPISESTIYMVPTSDSTSNNQYDEYMVIGQNLERLGTFGNVNLSDYVTTVTFNQAINEIDEVLNNHTDEVTGETVYGLISRVENIEYNYVTHAQIGNLNQLVTSTENVSGTLVEEVNIINDRLKWHNLSEQQS